MNQPMQSGDMNEPYDSVFWIEKKVGLQIISRKCRRPQIDAKRDNYLVQIA